MERRLTIFKKRKRIILIAAFPLFILILFLIVYLIADSYINKMNLVAGSGASRNNTVQSTLNNNIDEKEIELTQEEGEKSSISDSPKEEVNLIENRIRMNMEENSIPLLYDDEVLNILLIGTDKRVSGDSERSDAMMLVSVNKKTEKIIVTSLLRDIYLKIPGKNNNRLNAAYAYGGAELLMETIEQNFKLKIDRFVSVDFYAFIEMVNIVGGVRLEVTQEEIPVINNYVKEINLLTGEAENKDYLTAPGEQQLNGKQALGYARDRYIGNNDFERTSRQRRVLEQIYLRVKGLNLIEWNEMLKKLLPQITTNLTEGELFTLILSLPSYIKFDIEQWSIPMASTYTSERIRGMAVLGIDFEKNISNLHEKVYDNVP